MIEIEVIAFTITLLGDEKILSLQNNTQLIKIIKSNKDRRPHKEVL